jgi:hypothetical protein
MFEASAQGLFRPLPASRKGQKSLQKTPHGPLPALFGANAEIVKTKVVASGDTGKVQFLDENGASFDWDSVWQELAWVVTICHGAPIDGPNLWRGMPTPIAQPWHQALTGSGFCQEGFEFWTKVQAALRNRRRGKIIMLGCDMGQADESFNYAQKVSWCTDKSVFAAVEEFAAGDAETAFLQVNAIKNLNKPMNGMKEFKPTAPYPADPRDLISKWNS